MVTNTMPQVQDWTPVLGPPPPLWCLSHHTFLCCYHGLSSSGRSPVCMSVWSARPIPAVCCRRPLNADDRELSVGVWRVQGCGKGRSSVGGKTARVSRALVLGRRKFEKVLPQKVGKKTEQTGQNGADSGELFHHPAEDVERPRNVCDRSQIADDVNPPVTALAMPPTLTPSLLYPSTVCRSTDMSQCHTTDWYGQINTAAAVVGQGCGSCGWRLSQGREGTRGASCGRARLSPVGVESEPPPRLSPPPSDGTGASRKPAAEAALTVRTGLLSF